jgi:hypothetical protein
VDRIMNFRVDKMLGNSLVVEGLLTYQEGPRSIEFVSYKKVSWLY